MSVKKQLQHSLWVIASATLPTPLRRNTQVILKHNKDGSFATQANRKKIGYQIAASLLEAGYKLHHIRGLKPKHIRCLVTKWQQSGLAVGTIKNRLACVNWFCEKIDNPGIVLSSAELGIGKRVYVSNENKAIQLDETLLAKISDKSVQLSLQLQQQFGLRREEALKLKPFIVDKETELELQGSWCKNGRSRTVPIRTIEQRKILEQCKQHLQSQQLSMIPKAKSYIQHLKIYEQQLRRAGIYHAHGLRHAYAQQRYKELTSWDCPACGGRSSKDYRGNDMVVDKRAREIISEELGHARIEIVAQYIGR